MTIGPVTKRHRPDAAASYSCGAAVSRGPFGSWTAAAVKVVRAPKTIRDRPRGRPSFAPRRAQSMIEEAAGRLHPSGGLLVSEAG